MLLPYFVEGVFEAGCDEAGRGSLVGSVFAAAVMWKREERFEQSEFDLITDSKRLSVSQREHLRQFIEQEALCYAVCECNQDEIAHLNILNASIKAMHKALDSLAFRPEHIIADGNRWQAYCTTDTMFCVPAQSVVKGDGKYLSIAAASILAKTYRDDYMRRLAEEYPQYHWQTNMGYGTKEHYQAIKQYGISPYHRRNFKLFK